MFGSPLPTPWACLQRFRPSTTEAEARGYKGIQKKLEALKLAFLFL
jgi:hypothetical protein